MRSSEPRTPTIASCVGDEQLWARRRNVNGASFPQHPLVIARKGCATQNQGIDNPQRHDAHPEVTLRLAFLVHGEPQSMNAATTQRQSPSRETLAAFAWTTRVIEISRRPSWPSVDALVRIACCERLRSASRVAQPSSSAEHAVFFAIGS